MDPENALKLYWELYFSTSPFGKRDHGVPEAPWIALHSDKPKGEINYNYTFYFIQHVHCKQISLPNDRVYILSLLWF